VRATSTTDRPRRRVSTVVALLLTLAIVAQACSSDDDPSADADRTTETTSEARPTVTTADVPAAGSADAPPLGWPGPSDAPAGTCDVDVAADDPIGPAIDRASAGDVVCVTSSNRPDEIVTVSTSGIELLADGAVLVAGIDVLANDVLVEGFEVTNDSLDPELVGIYVAGRDVKIVGNFVHDTTAEGIACSDDLGEICDGITIRHNTLLRNVGVQVETWGSDITVEGNDIRVPVWTEEGRDTDSLRVMGGSNQVIRGNYFEIPDINEITPDPHPDCLMMFDSENPKYVEWVINVDVVIENNICVNDSEHNCFILSGRQQQRSRGFVIRNNVCDHAGTNAFFIEDIDDVLLANNLCTDRLGRNCIALVGAVGEVTSQNNVLVGDGVLHQVNIPEDTTLVELTNYQGAIEFDDPTSDNPWMRYRPVSDPALVDGGTDSNLANDDIVGNERIQGEGPDIGPYESGP
jgi:hypothetical protein